MHHGYIYKITPTECPQCGNKIERFENYKAHIQGPPSVDPITKKNLPPPISGEEVTAVCDNKACGYKEEFSWCS